MDMFGGLGFAAEMLGIDEEDIGDFAGDSLNVIGGGMGDAVDVIGGGMGDAVDIMGGGMQALGGGMRGVDGDDLLMALGVGAVAAGVAGMGVLMMQHLDLLNKSGAHLDNRMAEIPYQINGNIKPCIGLFIGCRYPGSKAELSGCVNDLKQSIRTIQKLLGVRFRSLYIGVDDGTQEHFFDIQNKGAISRIEFFYPNRRNIEKYYNRVLREAADDAFVWLHFSGHGGNQRDENGDEEDGRDETVIPSDYQEAGVIVDDWLHQEIMDYNSEVSMIACFDCCHSGSMLDLEGWENCKVVCLSGCQDDQTSADCSPSDPTKGAYGAFTTCMSRAILNMREDNQNPMDMELDDLEEAINHEIKQIRCSQISNITISRSDVATLGSVMYEPPDKIQDDMVYNNLPTSNFVYNPSAPPPQQYGGGPNYGAPPPSGPPPPNQAYAYVPPPSVPPPNQQYGHVAPPPGGPPPNQPYGSMSNIPPPSGAPPPNQPYASMSNAPPPSGAPPPNQPYASMSNVPPPSGAPPPNQPYGSMSNIPAVNPNYRPPSANQHYAPQPGPPKQNYQMHQAPAQNYGMTPVPQQNTQMYGRPNNSGYSARPYGAAPSANYGRPPSNQGYAPPPGPPPSNQPYGGYNRPPNQNYAPGPPGGAPPPNQPYVGPPGGAPPPNQPYVRPPGGAPPPNQPYVRPPGGAPPPNQPYAAPPRPGYAPPPNQQYGRPPQQYAPQYGAPPPQQQYNRPPNQYQTPAPAQPYNPYQRR